MAAEVDNEIIEEFKKESISLIEELLETLEAIEGDFSQVKRLEGYGQSVDRIMGGAQSLAMQMTVPNLLIRQIGDYAAVCKAVGYKASQIPDNPDFFDVCVAFLLDATELLQVMVEKIESNGEVTVKDFISTTFIERLKWLSDKFGKEYRASVDIHRGGKEEKMNQEDIDSLMKKLGLG